MRRSRLVRIAASLLVLAALAGSPRLLGRCSQDQRRHEPSFATAPERPAQPDLSTPESSVKAYTQWISYAYGTMDSSVATKVCTPYQAVRIDSYIEFNRQSGRYIDQRLRRAQYRLVAATATSATVSGLEDWTYRYASSSSRRYIGAGREASYEVTYTVLNERGDRWLVDVVEALRPAVEP